MKAKTDRLQSKIRKMRQRMRDLQVIKVQLGALPELHLSKTDLDARAKTTHSAKGTAIVG